ncbi:hypothetical protein C1701_10425 [Actinoalloteichus sp. AHMU CJ021]|uniref:ESX secretion-associated protein EspG n=1 Tax=Actinoalloteichus sp. AHMU CJ021 TaxID=2072503 RepID=UPI000CA0022C|nr:hypothetical protein C1701_10425 [Actinoalloteichus sp. AHMU CJ021]
MPAQDQVRLSVAQVDSIRVRLGLALPPTLLAGGRGTTQDERRVLLRRAWRELEAERWVDGGEPHPFLHRAFQTLARPAVAVSVAVEEVGGQGWNAVAAREGTFGVVAILRDQPDEDEWARTVVLEPIPPTSVAYRAAAVLPPVPGGGGPSISHPSDPITVAADQAGRDVGRLRSALRRAGLRTGEAGHLAEALTANRLRAGEFSVRGFDPLAGRRRADHTVEFVDTARGRHLAQHRPGPDGRRWFTFVSGDARRLVGRLEELVVQVGAP